jgi:hypothetical protein
VACFERGFDAVGNVTSEARTASVKCSDTHTPAWNTYTYFDNNRLKQAAEFGTTTTFGYDGAGNRTSVQVEAVHPSPRRSMAAGFPSPATDGTTSTTYTTDPLGELTCVTTSTCAAGTNIAVTPGAGPPRPRSAPPPGTMPTTPWTGPSPRPRRGELPPRSPTWGRPRTR